MSQCFTIFFPLRFGPGRSWTLSPLKAVDFVAFHWVGCPWTRHWAPRLASLLELRFDAPGGLVWCQIYGKAARQCANKWVAKWLSNEFHQCRCSFSVMFLYMFLSCSSVQVHVMESAKEYSSLSEHHRCVWISIAHDAPHKYPLQWIRFMPIFPWISEGLNPFRCQVQFPNCQVGIAQTYHTCPLITRRWCYETLDTCFWIRELLYHTWCTVTFCERYRLETAGPTGFEIVTHLKLDGTVLWDLQAVLELQACEASYRDLIFWCWCMLTISWGHILLPESEYCRVLDWWIIREML